MRTVLHEAAELGQSVWLDTISRDLILSGGLERWIEQGVVGVTTNPSIFEQAIANTKDYDGEIAAQEAARLMEVFEVPKFSLLSFINLYKP